VDPLDGTKEFIAGSEEFTVNIALIEHGRVVFGVVSMPTNGRCYFGGAGLGAWRADVNEAPKPIQVRDAPAAGEPLPWWPAVGIPARSRSVCWPV
jgi:3'(2'), 5'-bisphosphate nucleotidase